MQEKYRRFLVSDLVILVAAFASGFALTRDTSALEIVSDGLSIHISAESGKVIRGAKNSWVWYRRASGAQSELWSLRIQQPLFRVTPCLASCTIAALVLSLRRPRPPLRRLFRRPGTVASVAVVSTLAAVALQYPMLWLDRAGIRIGPNTVSVWQLWRIQIWFFLPRFAGYSVAVCWLVLSLGGRWRANAGWIDRLGQLLGICWMALALASVVASFLFAMSL